jgi:acetone carboxylase gamma subunit
MQCWDKLPKNYKKNKISKLQEGNQYVNTSGMHSMYSNYKKFANYTKVLGTILNVGKNFLR